MYRNHGLITDSENILALLFLNFSFWLEDIASKKNQSKICVLTISRISTTSQSPVVLSM